MIDYSLQLDAVIAKRLGWRVDLLVWEWKIFAIDFYTANILGCLKDDARIPYLSKDYPNIRVFFPYWLCRRITEQGREELMYRYKSYKITRQVIFLTCHPQTAEMLNGKCIEMAL